ncbi:MAG: 4Fe-4S binding protein [Candidatus Thermoplasmatota archaeon]
MGMEKYGLFVKRTDSTLTYDPGWSLENLTGYWRILKPIVDKEKCNKCSICWLYCPEGIIDKRANINYEYCKGCGICAEECPKKAINMVEE